MLPLVHPNEDCDAKKIHVAGKIIMKRLGLEDQYIAKLNGTYVPSYHSFKDDYPYGSTERPKSSPLTQQYLKRYSVFMIPAFCDTVAKKLRQRDKSEIMDSVVNILAIADCKELENRLAKLISGNFKCLQNRSLVKICDTLLSSILKYDFLECDSEEDVLNCILSWYNHDKENRKSASRLLLQGVRFPFLELATIINTRKNYNCLFEDEVCNVKSLMAIEYHVYPYRRQSFLGKEGVVGRLGFRHSPAVHVLFSAPGNQNVPSYLNPSRDKLQKHIVKLGKRPTDSEINLFLPENNVQGIEIDDTSDHIKCSHCVYGDIVILGFVESIMIFRQNGKQIIPIPESREYRLAHTSNDERVHVCLIPLKNERVLVLQFILSYDKIECKYKEKNTWYHKAIQLCVSVKCSCQYAGIIHLSKMGDAAIEESTSLGRFINSRNFQSEFHKNEEIIPVVILLDEMHIFIFASSYCN